jgi:hypothetical protein
MAKFEGAKYRETQNLNIVEIAKLVRKDLKEAFPKYKFGVRVEKFSMGQAIHIKVNNTGFNRRDANDSEAIKMLQQAVKQVGDAYNYDDSDPMTDYFATKFYNHDIQVES